MGNCATNGGKKGKYQAQEDLEEDETTYRDPIYDNAGNIIGYNIRPIQELGGATTTGIGGATTTGIGGATTTGIGGVTSTGGRTGTTTGSGGRPSAGLHHPPAVTVIRLQPGMGGTGMMAGTMGSAHSQQQMNPEIQTYPGPGYGPPQLGYYYINGQPQMMGPVGGGVAVPSYHHGGFQNQSTNISQQPMNMQPLLPSNQHKVPPKLTGRQKALLIGCNYPRTRAELKGCITDVTNVFDLLTNTFGWEVGTNPKHEIHILTDEGGSGLRNTFIRKNSVSAENCWCGSSTKQNIFQGLRWLAADAKPGDVLFLLFSGHGSQKEDPHGYEEDGMNETILPTDFQKAGMITDDELGDQTIRVIPEGCRLTCLMDSCHSGTGLDLPWTWKPTTGRWMEDTNPFHTVGDVQMFSGCEDSQCSSDGGNYRGSRAGAMTTAFCETMRLYYGQMATALSYHELLQRMHEEMLKKNFKQRPQLTSSQPFEMDRLFILDSIQMNRNPQLGRIFRRKFPPQPRPGSDLGSIFNIGAGVVGGFLLADMLF